MLGDCKKTERGFSLVEFKDAYGYECSLQQSSAVDVHRSLDNPGSSFVWLGVNNPEPSVLKSVARKLGLQIPESTSSWVPYPIPEDVLIHSRMHLNRKQVEALVSRLQLWLATGDFESSVDCEKQRIGK